MLDQLKESDWMEAFWAAGASYAEAGDWGPGSAHGDEPVLVVGSDPIPTTRFCRSDVAEIYGISEGDNDGPNWICYGRLKDDRVFLVDAGCDYTGWG